VYCPFFLLYRNQIRIFVYVPTHCYNIKSEDNRKTPQIQYQLQVYADILRLWITNCKFNWNIWKYNYSNWKKTAFVRTLIETCKLTRSKGLLKSLFFPYFFSTELLNLLKIWTKSNTNERKIWLSTNKFIPYIFQIYIYIHVLYPETKRTNRTKAMEPSPSDCPLICWRMVEQQVPIKNVLISYAH